MFVTVGVMGSGAWKEVAIWAGKSEIGSRVLHCARGGDRGGSSIEIFGRDPNHGRSEITERVARSETPERTIFGSSVDRDQRRPKVANWGSDQGGDRGAHNGGPYSRFYFCLPKLPPLSERHYP